MLRARTYQRYLVALTYEGLRQAVEALAVWLAGGNAWVCNGIVREGGGRGGRAVGFVSFELV